jgi:Tfp pilus assembly protein PilP
MDTTAIKPVNPATAKAATEPSSLPLGKLQLLGIVIRPTTSEALFRTPEGETFWVKSGSQTPYGKVIALDDTSVILGGRSRTQRFELLG